LVLWRWFLGVFGVVVGDGFLRVFEVRCWIPRPVCVRIAGPLDSVLDVVAVLARVANLFKFPLLFVVDNDWRRRRLFVSGYWF